jgi:hypothetical protein
MAGYSTSQYSDEVVIWGFLLFEEYLNRAGITDGDILLDRCSKSYYMRCNINNAAYAFLRYYNKTWADAVGDLLEPVVRKYLGLNMIEDPKRMVEICPDAAAIIRLGAGPYIEADKDIPSDVWTAIYKQLKVDQYK